MDTTNKIVNNLNKEYTKIFGKTFTDACDINNQYPNNTEKAPSKFQIEKEAMKNMAKNMTEQWAETSVER